MNTLIIDKKQEQLIVKGQKLHTKTHTVPLKLIDMLILSQDIIIDIKTVLKLTSSGIALLYLSSDNKKIALTLPQFAKNSELKMMQYNAVQNHLSIAKKLVMQKFQTHKTSLQNHGIDIEIDDDLANLATAKDLDSVLGIEGVFAKRYFSHYFGLFERKLTKGFRSKNPPLDPINAMLSFVYTLTYNTVAAKLYMRGFDPSISYLHRPFRSHYALSSDLMEPLRAPINDFVASLFLNQKLTLQDFTHQRGVYLKNTKRREIWKELKPFMDKQNKQINTQIANLKKEIAS